jgi:hypothetical protein
VVNGVVLRKLLLLCIEKNAPKRFTDLTVVKTRRRELLDEGRGDALTILKTI